MWSGRWGASGHRHLVVSWAWRRDLLLAPGGLLEICSGPTTWVHPHSPWGSHGEATCGGKTAQLQNQAFPGTGVPRPRGSRWGPAPWGSSRAQLACGHCPPLSAQTSIPPAGNPGFCPSPLAPALGHDLPLLAEPRPVALAPSSGRGTGSLTLTQSSWQARQSAHGQPRGEQGHGLLGCPDLLRPRGGICRTLSRPRPAFPPSSYKLLAAGRANLSLTPDSRLGAGCRLQR